MEEKLLIVIDVQSAFVNDSTKDTVKSIEEIVNSGKFENIVFTRFINSKENVIYKKLGYTECIDEKSRKIVIETKDYPVVDKTTYTAYSKKIVDYINKENITEIYLCGFDTDCCVLKTMLDFFENGYDVKMIENCTASSGGNELDMYAKGIIKRNCGEDAII